MVDAQRIQQVSDEIARRFHPERIILFGSYAYGTPTEDSDVDLLVVMPADERDTKKAIEIRQTVGVNFAMDLLVYDPKYLQQRIEWEDWFVREITEKGRVLYEAAHAGVG